MSVVKGGKLVHRQGVMPEKEIRFDWQTIRGISMKTRPKFLSICVLLLDGAVRWEIGFCVGDQQKKWCKEVENTTETRTELVDKRTGTLHSTQ